MTSLIYSITIIYTVWGLYHLILIGSGLRKPLEPSLDIKEYPTLSIIIPAKNEPILSRTIETCLYHVSYPMDKKEIIVVADDQLTERIGFWYQQRYPGMVKLLARRNYYPTKPSALNDAIHISKGEIVTIVDAEDIPEKDIFLKAVSALTNYDYGIAQAILRISNRDDSWITRIFSMEYSAWFRIWLNGRYKLGLFSPLGGTGNYFKRSKLDEVGKWDSTNLAEDAEITVRLTIAGAKTVVINGVHWEEAPVTYKAWIKQRTRWYRGWLQSLWHYAILLWKPFIIRRIGIKMVIGIILMLIAPLIVVMQWIAYALTVYWIMEEVNILHTTLIEGRFPIMSYLPLAFNVLYYYIWLKGGALEGVKFEKRYIFYMFYYLNVMMAIAAMRALYQEIFKPIFWEKTEHPGRGVRWVVNR